MKNSKIIVYLMLVSLSFLFIQCTSEYAPIPGPAGIDGIDGVDGIAGTDAEATCVACHSESHREPINNSFLSSKHYDDGAYVRGASASCAQCHGTEGYLDYINTGAVNEDGYAGIISPMSCTTCHEKHSTFDFENDGHDFALRHFDPVTLVIDDATVIDFNGTSNNCIVCHQPRNSYEIPGSTGDYEITSKRFGPHHGPQATFLEGVMGANIAGTQAYPAVASSTHRTGASCVSCHMGEASSDNTEGLHSWNPNNEAACTACHTTIPTEVDGLADDMETLRQLLDDNGMFDADGYYVTGIYSSKLSQAAWNYRTVLEDGSNGIHNPIYTKALVKNSIEALQN